MRTILTLQAIYYLFTGIWPLVHLASFEAVTGPKTDDWLVQTVGVLAAVIGAALFIGSRHDRPIEKPWRCRCLAHLVFWQSMCFLFFVVLLAESI
jgi:hypothetical protein